MTKVDHHNSHQHPSTTETHVSQPQASAQQQNKPAFSFPSLLGTLFTWGLQILAVCLFLVYLGRIFIIQDYTVSGSSMETTIHNGQKLMVNTWAYMSEPPQRGDIVVLIPPKKVTDNYVKRIIGLPGETVEIKGDNQVIIYNDDYPNGITLHESYIDETQKTEAHIKEKLGVDEFFVLGDNRTGSSDSRGNLTDVRSVWTLPRKNTIGKVLVIMDREQYVVNIGFFKIPKFTIVQDPEYNL
ncbi:MAG: signal peptidase I [bacterium]